MQCRQRSRYLQEFSQQGLRRSGFHGLATGIQNLGLTRVHAQVCRAHRQRAGDPDIRDFTVLLPSDPRRTALSGMGVGHSAGKGPDGMRFQVFRALRFGLGRIRTIGNGSAAGQKQQYRKNKVFQRKRSCSANSSASEASN
ncbi:MAG: hypothetical protein RIS14_254 [Pseudomonadota bacterium]